jgi:hypothetical protein
VRRGCASCCGRLWPHIYTLALLCLGLAYHTPHTASPLLFPPYYAHTGSQQLTHSPAMPKRPPFDNYDPPGERERREVWAVLNDAFPPPPKHRHYALSKLRAIVDATSAIVHAASNAPLDASAYERRSLCGKAAPPYLTVRIGSDCPIPELQTVKKQRPWDGPADTGARAVLEYAVGIGVDSGEGARMPDDLFRELLTYVGKPSAPTS